MKLYFAAGTYVGTQTEAKAMAKRKGGDWRLVEVPTDKDGLLAFLNVMDSTAELATALRGLPAANAAPIVRAMDATAILSRSDNPGTDVDAIIETIGKAKGYALKRYAGAVAVAFHALEN